MAEPNQKPNVSVQEIHDVLDKVLREIREKKTPGTKSDLEMKLVSFKNTLECGRTLLIDI